MSNWNHRLVVSCALIALAMSAQGCAEEEAIAAASVGSACSSATPCADGLFCYDGLCFDATEVGCKADADCPDAYKCLSTGLCQADAQCETSFDCCAPGDVTCEMVCENYQCVGTACTAGQTEVCYNDCHKGERRCNLGAWTGCDAAVKTAEEICGDGIDNNCLNGVDENCPDCVAGETVVCETPCGTGEDLCQADGTWRGCDAPTDCTCTPGDETTEPCGVCGTRAGTCSPSGTWVWSELCEENGECAPGDEETSATACGLCGSQRRSCQDTCLWGEWSECQDEGECSPGAEEQESCGTCGWTSRVCDESCVWGEWSTCDQTQGCSPGEIDEQSCGLCGTKTRVCDGSCGWSDFGPCMNEGSCSPGMVDDQACGMCGSQERTCNDSCEWGTWAQCSGMGLCSPGTVEEKDCGPTSDVGICEQGTSTRTCGTGCQWNAWGSCLGATYETSEVCGNGLDEDCDGSDWTVPDDYEPNNTCSTCKWLGEDPDFTGDDILFGSFDNVNDEVDYYCFDGIDDSPPIYCPWCSENIKIELENQSFGMDADLALFRKTVDDDGNVLKTSMENCEDYNPFVTSVTIGPDDESISWSESSKPDTDFYILRVKNYEASDCWGSYELSVKGLD